MSEQEYKELGKTLWAIADDFRDYTLSFLFLRYLFDNCESAVKKELGADYRDAPKEELKTLGVATPLQLWYKENEARAGFVAYEFLTIILYAKITKI